MRQSPDSLLAQAGIGGFVDLHCHLAAGLDDGPADPSVSARLIERARRARTQAIVATPHSSARYRFDRTLRDRRLEELEQGGSPAVFGGCEIELSAEGLEPLWRNPSAVTIHDSPYLLLEAPPQGFATALESTLPKLADLGLRPILAHPERLNEADRALAVGYHRAGLLFQVTGSALTGSFGPRIEAIAWRLLERGVVDFTASDAHGVERRPPDLFEAFCLTAERFGLSTAADLFTWNPLAVLASSREKALATSG